MADENRMITFQHAKNNWGAYRLQEIPDSLECMTKTDVGNYLNADMSVLSNYLPNQLIPRSKFFGIPIGVPNDIVVGDTMGYGGADLNSFSDAKWNANSETEAASTPFGYSKIIGVKLYVNKTEAERQTIVSASSDYTSPANQYYPIFVDSTNKHLVKKIRIINPDYADPEYPMNEGLYYNDNVDVRRKCTFVVQGSNFVGDFGNRVTDIPVSPIGDTDVTLGNLYIGCTRLYSGWVHAKLQGHIMIQVLGINDAPFMVRTVWSPDTTSLSRIIGYSVEFRQPAQ